MIRSYRVTHSHWISGILKPATTAGFVLAATVSTVAIQSASAESRPLCTFATTTGHLAYCNPGGATYDAAKAEAMRTDDEFQFSNTSQTRKSARSVSPAEKINAHIAHGYGFTGKGITLGIIDSGFNIDNGSGFNSHTDLEGQLTSADPGTEMRNHDHGSIVAALAVGKRHGDGTGGQGIAYGAHAVVSNEAVNQKRYSQVINTMGAINKATVLNNSYGFPLGGTLSASEVETYTIKNGTNEEVQFDKFIAFMRSSNVPNDPVGAFAKIFGPDREHWENIRTALRNFQTANPVNPGGTDFFSRQGRGVIVWANSNNGPDSFIMDARQQPNGMPSARRMGMTNVDATAAFPLVFPELQGQWIVVSNVIDKGVSNDLQNFARDIGDVSNLITADILPQWQKDQIVSKKDGAYTGRYLISAPCGAARDFCVSMDGGQVRGAGDGDAGDANEYINQLGTSHATPQISGAVALLLEAFPNLSGRDIVTRLFVTADNSWFDHDAVVQLDHGLSHGASNIWGHGFIDLAKALAPIGGTSAPSISGETFVLSDGSSTISLSPAFGAGAAEALDGASFTVQDVMDAEFTTSVGAYAFDASSPFVDDVIDTWSTIRTEQRFDAGTGTEISFARRDAIGDDRDMGSDIWRLSTDMGGGRATLGSGDTLDAAFGFTATAPASPDAVSAKRDEAFDNPLFSLAEDEQYWGAFGVKAAGGDLTFGAFNASDDELDTYGFGMNYTHTPSEGIELLANAGVVVEDGGLLGTKMTGAFANGEAVSAFGQVGMRVDLGGGFNAKGVYSMANTTTDGAGGLVTGFSPILSDSFALGVEKRKILGENDHLSLSFSQPLRVISAEANLDLPTGVDANGRMGFASSTVDLAPEARELRLTAAYATPLAQNMTLDLGVAAVRNAGHIERDDLDFAGFVGMNIKF